MIAVMEVETQVKDGVYVWAQDELAAAMLIQSFVSPEEQDHMTYQEAYDLALIRDEQAADDLEASIMAVLDSEEDPAEEADAAAAINALLETAAMADAAVSREVEGL